MGGEMGEVMSTFGSDVIAMGDIQEYITVIKSAFAVHSDREKIRKGLWKDYPARDQVFQMKVKIGRIERSLEGELTPEQSENIVSELHDIINYAVFAARIIEGRI